jgi:hypothetical protein
MSRTMEIIGYIGELCWWILPKLITFAAVLGVVWGIMSWHDIVSDNLTSTSPASEGNMFVEIMEVAEWFN